MEKTSQPGREAAAGWSRADEKRLRRLIVAMWPITKIIAEFPDHDANAVRGALTSFFMAADRRPAEKAMHVLGGRAAASRRCPTGFTLDGRPAAVAQLVTAANEILVAYGEQAIPYPRVPAE